MTSMHLLAMPKDIAARTILSNARLRIMHTDAPPSSPTMFARGTLDQHTWNLVKSKKQKVKAFIRQLIYGRKYYSDLKLLLIIIVSDSITYLHVCED
jgi:hypothetical protein